MQSNYNAALVDAIDRDLRDEERLNHIAELIARMLDALIPDMHDMEHPDSRWHPCDLVDDLQAHADSIRKEKAHLRGPVVLDEY